MPPPSPFVLELDVRSYEVDVFGHVNNAVYLQWLEQARSAMAVAWGMDRAGGDILPVVRHIELDFQMELFFGDRVEVSLAPRRRGTTSMTFAGQVRLVAARTAASRVGRLALEATQVIVCVRRGEGKVPLPAAWATAFPAPAAGARE